MSARDSTPSAICRIIGLSSEAGKKRNGSAALVNLQSTSVGSDARRQVSIDGFPGPILIKQCNIELFNSGFDREVGVGVGRQTINNVQTNAVLVENSQIIDRDILTGGSMRSRGNVKGMEKFAFKHAGDRKRGSILIKLTDLNIARAFNRHVFGDDDVKIADPLKQSFQKILKKFPRNTNAKSVLVRFEAHRITEDRFEPKKMRPGALRFESIKHGAFQIYPCAHKDYLDALEVRYADPMKDDIVIKHEIYLDYGQEEAMDYARHAVAMGEAYRLSPPVLAQVDPQAFWSAILWLEPFIETLKTLDVSDELRSEWVSLKSGKDESKSYSEKIMKVRGFSPEGAAEKWGITKKSKDVHLRIATDYAIGAVDAIRDAVMTTSQKRSSMGIQTLDWYIGTDLDKYILGTCQFYKLWQKEKEETGQTLDDLSDDRMAKLYNRAMKSVGFGNDSRFMADRPDKTCDYCGKKSKKKLQACARCEGATYCSVECQHSHWREHRSSCSRVLVQLQRSMNRMSMNGPKMNYVCGPSPTLPTEPALFSEVSGTGTCGIYWMPGSTSSVHLAPYPDDSSDVQDVVSNAQSFKFTEFSELPPPLRVLVCCGPLPQIDVAKASISEALQCCGGQLNNLRIPVVGFSALEWAAKKGNIDIVRWLCDDERTKGLIHIGCPIGWAGYTGQVEIMRLLVEYGANPNKTDAVLFSFQPPLMLAASNGQLEAMKFYINECGLDINMLDNHGKGIMKYIKDAPNWREMPSHVACRDWAKSLLKSKHTKK